MSRTVPYECAICAGGGVVAMVKTLESVTRLYICTDCWVAAMAALKARELDLKRKLQAVKRAMS